MNQETAALLQSLSDKLGVSVEHLRDGLVAYAPFVFYEWVVMMLVIISFMVASVVTFLYYRRKQQEDDYETVCIGSVTVFAISLMLFFIAGISSLADSLAAKQAPQAWAAKYILNSIRR